MVDVLLERHAAEIRHRRRYLGQKDRHLAALGVLTHKKVLRRNMSGEKIRRCCRNLILVSFGGETSI